MSLTCHSSLGPSFGHSLSRPVSLETPSRCGPRHCGQSAATAIWPNKKAPVAMRKNMRFFMKHLAGKVVRLDPQGDCKLRTGSPQECWHGSAAGNTLVGGGPLRKPNRWEFAAWVG